jgi:hypothetical protein
MPRSRHVCGVGFPADAPIAPARPSSWTPLTISSPPASRAGFRSSRTNLGNSPSEGKAPRLALARRLFIYPLGTTIILSETPQPPPLQRHARHRIHRAARLRLRRPKPRGATQPAWAPTERAARRAWGPAWRPSRWRWRCWCCAPGRWGGGGREPARSLLPHGQPAHTDTHAWRRLHQAPAAMDSVSPWSKRTAAYEDGAHLLPIPLRRALLQQVRASAPRPRGAPPRRHQHPPDRRPPRPACRATPRRWAPPSRPTAQMPAPAAWASRPTRATSCASSTGAGACPQRARSCRPAAGVAASKGCGCWQGLAPLTSHRAHPRRVQLLLTQSLPRLSSNAGATTTWPPACPTRSARPAWATPAARRCTRSTAATCPRCSAATPACTGGPPPVA